MPIYLKYDSMSSSSLNTVLVNEGGLSKESINLDPKLLARWPRRSISASLLSMFEMFVLLCKDERTSLTVRGFLLAVIIFWAS